MPVEGFVTVDLLMPEKISVSSSPHLGGFSVPVDPETWTEEQQTELLNP